MMKNLRVGLVWPCLLCLGVMFLTNRGGAVPVVEKLPPIEEMFRRADANYDRIAAIQFKAERTLERGMQKQEERWEVLMQKPDLVRVETQGPPKRVVISKKNVYSEYLPDAKKALELDAEKLSGKALSEMVAALMPRVSIPGFRLGISDDLRKRMAFRVERTEDWNGQPAVVIIGEDTAEAAKRDGKSGKGRMTIRLHRQNFSLLRLEIYDGSRFVSSIENQAFREFPEGLTLPTRVMVQNNTESALEKAAYRLSAMRVNHAVDPELFTPRYAEGTQVERPKTGAPAGAQK